MVLHGNRMVSLGKVMSAHSLAEGGILERGGGGSISSRSEVQMISTITVTFSSLSIIIIIFVLFDYFLVKLGMISFV